MVENHTVSLVLNDQYLKAAAVGDVEKLLGLVLCGRRCSYTQYMTLVPLVPLVHVYTADTAALRLWPAAWDLGSVLSSSNAHLSGRYRAPRVSGTPSKRSRLIASV